ncbi:MULTISPECIES: MFS transporter [unclassified Streptomyces]|uniref:MFS transporter n=1 Tax=unclassified Streptomyces TaxID=2593676 RepID=UPI002E31E8B0|nr:MULTISPECIES: MFS transporter [unclassified Streptomyces]
MTRSLPGARGLAALFPSTPARRPVLLMALGSFALGTDAFVISGVLPSLGQDLGVSVGTAGLLITVFAAVYAVAAPFVAVGASRLDRRTILLVALSGFVIANVVAALAPNYSVLMAARVIAALATALFMPAASASAAAIVAPEERGRALTAVLGGITLASALGVPAGTIIASVANWRATFLFVALLSMVALLGLARALPSVPSAGDASIADRARATVIHGVPAILLVSMLTFCGMFALYAYLAWFSRAVGDLNDGAIAGVYLTYGVCGILSNLMTGLLIDRFPPERIALLSSGLLVIIMGLLTLLAFVGSKNAATVVTLFALIVLWSLIGWTLNPALQKCLINAGGQQAQVVLSLSGSAVYAGQAVGSLAGGLALVHGAVSLMLTALGFQVLTVVIVTIWTTRRQSGITALPVIEEPQKGTESEVC